MVLVGNAHIDPVWIWDWHEGLHEVLATFRSALARLDENPDLVFSASSSAFFDWVERVDPDLFEQIRRAVAQGRWMLVGGQWVEPDCNIPSGEAVCRQFLHGQRYLASRFGRIARVGWNVDAFGHAGSLPQLVRAAGLRSYVMMRPEEHEKHIDSPLFRWVGGDGTAITAYRVPFAYATEAFGEEAMLRERTDALAAQARQLGLPLMCLFGIGNHGGGPSRLALSTIAGLTDESAGNIRLGEPESYFERVAALELPTVEGELQWHAVGCYSARTHTKQANARTERALVTAEALETLCRSFTGRDLASQDAMSQAWRSLLFSQFHDALGGTCTERSAEGIDLLTAEARALADRAGTMAMHTLVQAIDTWTEGADRAESMQASALEGLPIPLVVCNPLGWSTTATLTVPYPIRACTDAAGTLHPVQRAPSGEVTFSPTATLVQVPLPALGYARFWLHAAARPEGPRPDGGTAAEPDDGTTAYTLSNGMLDVVVDASSGLVSGLVDRRRDMEWMASEGLRCVVIDDASDTWSHGVARYEGTEQPLACEQVSVVESGAIRSTVRAVFRSDDTVLTQDVSVVRHRPFVDIRLEFGWGARHKVAKLVVPLALSDPACTAGAPYGAVPRPATGHEDPMVGWVDLSEDERGGVTCTSVGSYGYDAVGGRLRLTLVRSPRVADHGWGWGADDPTGYPFLDQGTCRFHVRLHPHAGAWHDGRAARWADEHAVTMPFVLDTWHHGPLGPHASVLDAVSGSIAVSAVKRAERAAGAVARVVETTGRETLATLSWRGHAQPWEARLRPYQVVTLFVPDDPAAAIRAIDLCEFVLDEGGGPAR